MLRFQGTADGWIEWIDWIATQTKTGLRTLISDIKVSYEPCNLFLMVQQQRIWLVQRGGQFCSLAIAPAFRPSLQQQRLASSSRERAL